MKKILILIAVCYSSYQLAANTLFDQLCAFNFNWEHYPLQVNTNSLAENVTEQEYVQLHLSHVIPILKANTNDGLNKEQSKMRTILIGILDDYRKAGQFPLNDYVKARIPVFIDRYNTYCAVGYLMRASGYNDLACAIAADNNLAWVKDITVDGVLEWQRMSGFTFDEIKLIQGAYDNYYPDAYLLPNKYEVPQKPEVIVRYFENAHGMQPKDLSSAVIWCKGEGNNGVLQGKWIQNYSVEFPWIEGYYSNGKRTGQWKEYYPGTNLLCRTENWRNDKLNGIRKRFDQSGKIIEEILFRDGMAVTKTNYNFIDSIYHVRKPIDSTHVSTEVYTLSGRLLAFGNERVYNPGNLLWFQNIELTALNSAAITSRDLAFDQSFSGLPHRKMFTLFSTPPLVEYFKEGAWKFYHEGSIATQLHQINLLRRALVDGYPHFASSLNGPAALCDDVAVNGIIDSIEVTYSNNVMQEFVASGIQDYIHFNIAYYPNINFSFQNGVDVYTTQIASQPVVRNIARYNQNHQRVGTWRYFNEAGKIAKMEMYMEPQAEPQPEENTTGVSLGDAWKQ